ncbi:phage holin family protein [Pseudomonas sp.]|uniref:phage holin family protein n=1 Tax=Pseudomonas sp. TaxID=306 RepID=UPI00272FE584|nr:phage holin family protein [Pseudomonas sp.]MDP2244028.1 phage holin family protein [Pseudomonas sp.]
MISIALTHITLALAASLFFRLFTYRRDGARFRRGVSLLATLIMGCAGAVMLYVMQGKLVVPVYAWPLVVLIAVFTASVMRCGGNLSSVLRNPTAWDGRERRE